MVATGRDKGWRTGSEGCGTVTLGTGRAVMAPAPITGARIAAASANVERRSGGEGAAPAAAGAAAGAPEAIGKLSCVPAVVQRSLKPNNMHPGLKNWTLHLRLQI